MPDNVYRYNGKELDETTGWYDYDKRYYDPAIARWGQVDPLAEEFANWSPYSYVYDNPLIHTDPTGMAPDDHIFYIVIQKGANVDADAISANTQAMLDQNGINMQVQVLSVGDEGFGDNYKDKLDDTDALTFIGSESFVENLYDRGDIDAGYSDDRAGYVNVDRVTQVYMNSELINEHYARALLHEGISH